MSSPDILLAAGDTAPVTKRVLTGPLADDGSAGAPIDLTGATVVFRYQPKNRSLAPVTRAATIVGAPTLGEVQVDWMATGGALAEGNYVGRFIVTFVDAHVMSFPNGDRTAASGSDALGDDDASFFWLQVAPDFVVVT